MPAPRKYSDELREQLGIPGPTLRNWFRGPGLAAGSSATATDAHERLVQLDVMPRDVGRVVAM